MKFNDPWSYCPSIELNIFQPIFGEWLKKAFTCLLPKSSKPAPKPEGIDSQFMESLVDSLVDSLMESLKESFKESFMGSFMGSFMESLFERLLISLSLSHTITVNSQPSTISLIQSETPPKMIEGVVEKAINDQLTAAKKPIAQVIRGSIEDTMADSVKPVLKAHRRKMTNRQSSIVNKSRDTHKAQRHCHKRRVILIGRKQRHDRKAAIRARDLLRDQSPESWQCPAQVNRDIRGHLRYEDLFKDEDEDEDNDEDDK
ncbi:hypothetical protein N7452_003118 [Penicillium brevicompactum]|uniref:Uncharacterized protein n=1 Tax=Penicillium brevicompactum TaxID=5074 RepID=A0A9W9ULA9_PENBR|nr:hypothetical protein N7452_003118 [Penicillium brevicompactum]